MKTILQKICGFLLLSVVVLSCNDVLTEQETHTDQCLIRISLSEQENSALPAARTIQPDSIVTSELSYRLTAQKGTVTVIENPTVTESWGTLEAMTSATLLLDVGEWTFTLNAYKAGREDAALSATITKTVVSGADNHLVFILETTESGVGSLCMELIVGTGGSLFSSVTATLCDTEEKPLCDKDGNLRGDLASSDDWASYNAATDGSLTQSWTTEDFSKEGFNGAVTFAVNDNVPSGTYMLFYTVVSTAGVESSFPVVAQVLPGNNSSGTLDISSSASGTGAVSFYTVFYDDGVPDEDIPVPTDTSLYQPGKSVTVLFKISGQEIKRTGYTFTGWKQQGTTTTHALPESADESVTFGMLEKNVTLIAQWEPRKDTAYKVRHWQQKLNDDKNAAAGTDKTITEPDASETEPTCVDYTLVEPEDYSNKGYSYKGQGQTLAELKKDTLPSEALPNYTGFKAPSFVPQQIAADGTTVVDVFYDRYECTITYVDNVEGEDIAMPQVVHTCYDAEVTLTFSGVTRENYDFVGWATSSTSTSAGYTDDADENRKVKMRVDSITLYAVWTLSVFTVTFNGNGGHLPNTEVSTYTQIYERNTNGVYTYNLNPNQFTREEYVFKGWASTAVEKYEANSSNVELVDGAEYTAQGNKTFYAVWNPIVPYKVRHFRQNVVGDDYTEVDSNGNVLASPANIETLTGEIGASTDAQAKPFIGFTAQSFNQETIESSGTEIWIYYTRNLHTVTYSNGLASDESDDTISLPFDGTTDEETGEPMYTQYRYGATVTVLFGAEREGYTLKRWSYGTTYYAQSNNTTSFAMGDTNVVLNADWNPNPHTPYKVRHWMQKLNAARTAAASSGTDGATDKKITSGNTTDDDPSNDNPTCPDYTLESTVDTDGQTANPTEAVAQNYTGFGAGYTAGATNVVQSRIAAAGTTIVDIFYDREKYDVKYNPNGAVDIAQESRPVIAVPAQTSWCYGATVTVNFTNTENVDMGDTTVSLYHGYTFLGWDTASNAQTATYTAPAEGNTTTFTMGAGDINLYAIWKKNKVGGDGGIQVLPPTYSDRNLALSPTVAADGNSVTFTAASGYASYVWFVDGVFSSSSNENTYTWGCSGKTADKYCITLIVTDSNRKTYSATTYVEIRK